MTKKQRNRIYKQACKRLLVSDDTFVCVALHLLTKFEYCNRQLLDLLPEFSQFMPEDSKIGYAWWEASDLDSRLNDLAFCIAMTE